MNYRALRRRVRALLDEIGVPEPWDVAEFCAAVARHRGRPIHLEPAELPPGSPDGAWLSGPTVDVIVYDATTAALRSEHIICHELGHMLLGHGGAALPGLAPALAPDLSPQTMRRMGILHRSGYDDVQEQEAEVAASLIWELAGRTMVAPRRALAGEQAEVVDRLAELMERGPRG